eukprot:1246791-Prorocentrum_lima.AAC.1
MLPAMRQLLRDEWNGSMRVEIAASIRAEMAPLRAEVQELRDQVTAQAQRLLVLEGEGGVAE